MNRKFFLDVNPKSTGASEIIETTKITVDKDHSDKKLWHVSVFSQEGEGWGLDECIVLHEKELRALYHLLTLKSDEKD